MITKVDHHSGIILEVRNLPVGLLPLNCTFIRNNRPPRNSRTKQFLIRRPSCFSNSPRSSALEALMIRWQKHHLTCRLVGMFPEVLCSWWRSDPDSGQWRPSPDRHKVTGAVTVVKGSYTQPLSIPTVFDYTHCDHSSAWCIVYHLLVCNSQPCYNTVLEVSHFAPQYWINLVQKFTQLKILNYITAKRNILLLSYRTGEACYNLLLRHLTGLAWNSLYIINMSELYIHWTLLMFWRKSLKVLNTLKREHWFSTGIKVFRTTKKFTYTQPTLTNFQNRHHKLLCTSKVSHGATWRHFYIHSKNKSKSKEQNQKVH